MTPLRVLVVAPTSPLAANLVEWLTEAGYEVILVTSFLAGKARLELAPSVLISEVRLGDYNGLHLALRAKAGDIPSIVVGNPDPVLEREAERLGVGYLTQRAEPFLPLERASKHRAFGRRLGAAVGIFQPLVRLVGRARPGRQRNGRVGVASYAPDDAILILSPQV